MIGSSSLQIQRICPALYTVDQYQANIGSTYCVCWIFTCWSLYAKFEFYLNNNSTNKLGPNKLQFKYSLRGYSLAEELFQQSVLL